MQPDMHVCISFTPQLWSDSSPSTISLSIIKYGFKNFIIFTVLLEPHCTTHIQFNQVTT